MFRLFFSSPSLHQSGKSILEVCFNPKVNSSSSLLLQCSFSTSAAVVEESADLGTRVIVKNEVTAPVPWKNAPEIDVYSLYEGKVVDRVQLPPFIFGAPIRPDIMHQAVVWHRASQRQGTHQAKTVGMVAHSTKKHHQQKGTGLARAGNRRAPQRRGGGVAFPPSPRDYSYPLPLKVRRLALRSVLSAKLEEGRLVLLKEDALLSHKTGEFEDLLLQNQLLWKKDEESRNKTLTKLLLCCPTPTDKNMRLASRQLSNVTLLPAGGLSVYEILRHTTLALCPGALESLTTRLMKDYVPSYEEVFSGDDFDSKKK